MLRAGRAQHMNRAIHFANNQIINRQHAVRLFQRIQIIGAVREFGHSADATLIVKPYHTILHH